MSSTKPPFRLTTVKAIKSKEPNGLSIASTFSGCGGSSLGFRMDGYNVRYALEFMEQARDTYLANFPDTYVDDRDIRSVEPEDILKACKMKIGELDVMEGSPPCASFSTSGKRYRDWGAVKNYSKTKQRTDDLFEEYLRLVDGVRPKVWVAENVKGIMVGKAVGYFNYILRVGEQIGYNMSAALLDSQWLACPTTRPRVIFMGVRKDLLKSPVFPTPYPWHYCWDEAITGKEKGWSWKLPEDGKMKMLWEWCKKRDERLFEKAHKALFDGKSSAFTHRRCKHLEPAPTIQQGSQDIYHPDLPRSLNIGEIAKLSTFPSDFKFTGSGRAQWERIGRAVPPVMMRHVAETIRKQILCP